jgi:hypothetical protein
MMETSLLIIPKDYSPSLAELELWSEEEIVEILKILPLEKYAKWMQALEKLIESKDYPVEDELKDRIRSVLNRMRMSKSISFQ